MAANEKHSDVKIEDKDAGQVAHVEKPNEDLGRRSSVTIVDLEARGRKDSDELSEQGEINYRSLAWWQGAMLMLAETVSLGVLGLPSVFSTLGMVGGIIGVLSLGALGTWTGYVIGKFKHAYPQAHNMADAGRIMGGPVLRDLFFFMQATFLIFIAASHVLTGSIALRTISNTGTCNVVWAVVIAAVCAVCTLPRTFKMIAHMSIVSFISIIAAVLITMIGLGVNGSPAPVEAVVPSDFGTGFLSFTSIIFAYAGHAAFLQIASEFSNPREFSKAVVALQITDTTIYLIVGITVYVYVGADAKSPALSNLGFTLSRVAYGVALPTIVIAGVINASAAAKLIFRRIYVDDAGHASRHYLDNTKTGWIVWTSVVFGIWIIGLILAEVIPFFEDLLGVISALFASLFTWSISGIFWLYYSRGRWFSNRRQSALFGLSVFLLFMGAFILVGGLYASIKDIAAGYSSGKFGTPFGCEATSA